MQQPQQPYDSSLKSLFEGLAAQIIPELVPGARMKEELNDEMLKPPLRADRVYGVLCKRRACILHIELETKYNSKVPYRLLEYCGILSRKHHRPVLSVVIYPFCTKLPKPPLRVLIGSQEVLTFHYRVIALWKLYARSYLNRRVVGMYALLPTMRGATYEILKQALDEMKEFHGENRRRLAEQILLFDTFLERTHTVSSEDKRKVQEYMKMFDSLLDESRFVKKKAAEAKEEGKAEGEIEALRQVVIEVVQSRFPTLLELTRQKVASLTEPQQLHRLIVQVTLASDQIKTREILDSVKV